MLTCCNTRNRVGR